MRRARCARRVAATLGSAGFPPVSAVSGTVDAALAFLRGMLLCGEEGEVD